MFCRLGFISITRYRSRIRRPCHIALPRNWTTSCTNACRTLALLASTDRKHWFRYIGKETTESVHCTITGPRLRMHHRPSARKRQHVTVLIGTFTIQNYFCFTLLTTTVSRCDNQISVWAHIPEEIFIYQILPISLSFLFVICVPCPRNYCSLCHVNLYVLLLLLLKTTELVHCTITGLCLRMRHRPSAHTL